MVTILYMRVSTAEQTIDHQEAQARQAGFQIDEVVADHGVSGVSTRLCERPEGKRLYDLLRKGDTLVVRWIDRLGRNYEDVCEVIQKLMKKGVVIRTVINGMTFDGSTKDPMAKAVRDALIGFMAAMGQAQAEATKAAQKAGIAHAKATDDTSYLGRRPSFTRAQFEHVKDLLAAGTLNLSQVAGLAKVSRQIVYRIRDNGQQVENTLAAWERWEQSRP